MSAISKFHKFVCQVWSQVVSSVEPSLWKYAFNLPVNYDVGKESPFTSS